MDTSCRVCLRTELNPSEDFYDLFSLCASLDFTLTPANAIMECAPVQVNENDDLSRYICSDCVEKLQTAYNFRTACIESDAVLHQKNSSNSKEKCTKNEDINNESVESDCYNKSKWKCKNSTEKNESFLQNRNEYPTNDQELFNQLQLDNLKEEITFSCNNCDKDFISSDDFEKHLCDKSDCKENNVSGNNETKYCCVLCKAQFDEEAHLREHIRLHTDNVSDDLGEDCNDCGQNFPSKDLLNKHVCEQNSVDTTGEEGALAPTVYSCTTCTKLFTNRAALDEHTLSHTNDEYPYVCDFCNKRFCRKYSMIIHRRGHTGDKPFKCEVCEQSYKLNSDLTKHMKEVHSSAVRMGKQVYRNAQNEFVCEDCPKKFTDRSRFIRHLLIHTGEFPFVCEVCGKAFRQQPHLRTHVLRYHTREKPHACNVCGSRFVTSTEMLSHSVMHSDAKPFLCTVCGKIFKLKGRLSQHMKQQHSDYRPYKCTYCNKGFLMYTSLQSHLRVHTGERPEVCDMCDKTFKEKKHLRMHRIRIHKIQYSTNARGKRCSDTESQTDIVDENSR